MVEPLDVPVLALRRLAQGLLYDPHGAEDVVQEAWLAALRLRPAPSRLAPWLIEAVKRLARNRRREEARRRAREELAARVEELPGADERAAQIEILHRLLDALGRLEEPYRSAVMLRYLEDHPPREIARRLGVPVNTARTHVRRGLERLRRDLDGERGGEREELLVALVPLAGRPWRLAVGSSSVWLVAAAAGLTGVSWFALHGASPRAPGESRLWSTPATTSGNTPSTDTLEFAGGRPDAREPAAPSELDAGVVRGPAPGLAVQELRGRVLDAAGRPAAGARVSRSWRFADPEGEQRGSTPEPFLFDDLHKPVTSDERGEFVLPKADDPFLFVLSADGKTGAVAPVDAKSDARLEVTLAPLVEVRGRFEVKTPGEPPKQTALWVAAGSGLPGFVAACISDSRAVRVELPPGTYTLWYSTDAVNLWSMSPLRDMPLVIQPGQAAVELGALELELPLVLHPQGIVLDAGGQPVRASLGEDWGVWGGRMAPSSGFETDENGRFRGSVEVYDATKELTLLALDEQRQQAALASWKPSAPDEPLEIRLQPAVHVFGRYRTPSGDVPSWTNTYISAVLPGLGDARPPRIAQCQSAEGQGHFDFRLPPGKYRLNGYGTGTKSANLELELALDAPERDLGVIELPQTIIARNTGKPALPWHVSDARGLSKDVQLADFRGKWVLLEFWGFW